MVAGIDLTNELINPALELHTQSDQHYASYVFKRKDNYEGSEVYSLVKNLI